MPTITNNQRPPASILGVQPPEAFEPVKPPNGREDLGITPTKPTEIIVESTKEPHKAADEDNVKLQNILDILGKNIEEKLAQKKELETEPTEPIDLEDDDDEIDDETQQQLDTLSNEVDTYDADIDAVEKELEAWKETADAATASLIANIKARYEIRREEMRDINKRAEASLRTWGLRTGATRYGGTIMTGVISEEESQGVKRLSALDAEEKSLILEAQNAKNERDFTTLHDKLAGIEEKRNAKVEALNALNKAIMDRNEEIQEHKTKISRQGAVASLISQGITDPTQLFGDLNYDAAGNLTGDISMEEINEVLKNMPGQGALKTQVVEVGGKKQLINTQTGEVIADLGETTNDVTTMLVKEKGRQLLIDKNTGEIIKEFGAGSTDDVEKDFDTARQIIADNADALPEVLKSKLLELKDKLGLDVSDINALLDEAEAGKRPQDDTLKLSAEMLMTKYWDDKFWKGRGGELTEAIEKVEKVLLDSGGKIKISGKEYTLTEEELNKLKGYLRDVKYKRVKELRELYPD